jgi:hypothetical protein
MTEPSNEEIEAAKVAVRNCPEFSHLIEDAGASPNQRDDAIDCIARAVLHATAQARALTEENRYQQGLARCRPVSVDPDDGPSTLGTPKGEQP